MNPGQNDYTFMLDTSVASVEGEPFNYTLTVSAEGDGLLLNNSYSFSQTVTDTRKVLFVTSETTDKKNAEELYAGDDIELTVKLLMNQSNIEPDDCPIVSAALEKARKN